MESTDPNGKKIRILNNRMDQSLCRVLAELNLTAAQSFLLGYLVRNRGCAIYPRDLEEQFQLKHSTVSGILGRLEAKGFLTFEADPQDRRCKRIRVLEPAVDCQARVEAVFQSWEEWLIHGFTAEEARLFGELLSRAVKNLGGDKCMLPIPIREELNQ